ncbi:hypothetical protein WN48_05946 [Eufriesea mexicana]|nr:hypothetical protein WN48_05946 [Eufriesea mexicana]
MTYGPFSDPSQLIFPPVGSRMEKKNDNPRYGGGHIRACYRSRNSRTIVLLTEVYSGYLACLSFATILLRFFAFFFACSLARIAH